MSTVFSERLSALRKSKKISQGKAAKEFGISQALMSHYENAAREPGIDFIVKACDYYGVSADYLLGLTEAPGEGRTVPQELSKAARELGGESLDAVAADTAVLMRFRDADGNPYGPAVDFIRLSAAKLMCYCDNSPFAEADICMCDALLKAAESKLFREIMEGGSGDADKLAHDYPLLSGKLEECVRTLKKKTQNI